MSRAEAVRQSLEDDIESIVARLGDIQKGNVRLVDASHKGLRLAIKSMRTAKMAVSSSIKESPE